VDCALDVDNLTVHLAITTPHAACPVCGSDARRIHSRYTRRLADLPCFGRAVRLHVTVRRFSCPHPDCPRRIFAERLPGFAEPHARTTARLQQTHTEIGYALGGGAGARRAIGLAMPTSPDALLRRVKQIEDSSLPPPRFVGIDDWAWRKGQRYGTIVVDLQRSRVVDLLPDRDADTVTNWLKEHPGVELISRDRWSDYAQAAAEAAPEAQQVADRWHLLKNLREAIERLFERESATIAQVLKTAEPAPGSGPAETGTLATEERPLAEQPSPPQPEAPAAASPRQQAQQAKRERRVERFERVRELHRQGRSIRGIARELGLSREAVRRYLRRGTCPDWRPGRPARSGLDRYRKEIDRRIAEGCTNASELHRDLAAQGCRLSYPSVRRYVSKRLAAAEKSRARVNAAKAPAPPLPSARHLSFAWVRRREDRAEDQQVRLNAVRNGSPELSAALDLADTFAALIRKQSPMTLTDWLARAESSSCPELQRFAAGIRRDKSAVGVAVRGPWSNGPLEGHVNRLKMIKRQMYGRLASCCCGRGSSEPLDGDGQQRCCWTSSGRHHRICGRTAIRAHLVKQSGPTRVP
jgi:transposase